MRTLRHLLARTLLAPFLLLPLLSCGYPKPSAKAVREALERSNTFAEPKTVFVPNHLSARLDESYGSGALDDRQLVRFDPVLAVLRAKGLIDFQDYAGPDGNGGYIHSITVSPAGDAPTDLFVEAEEDRMGPGFSQAHLTGWRLALGTRKVIRVSQVLDFNSPMADKLSPGYVQAHFDFQWVPTEAGKAFDQGSPAFDELGSALQQAVISTAALDSRHEYNAKAWLTRDKTGAWIVTLFDCRRCPQS